MNETEEKEFDRKFTDNPSIAIGWDDVKNWINTAFSKREKELVEKYHPIKADNYYSQEYVFEGERWVALVRVDDTDEKIEWVNKVILDRALEIYRKKH